MMKSLFKIMLAVLSVVVLNVSCVQEIMDDSSVDIPLQFLTPGGGFAISFEEVK
jgi:hypothetical protein